MGVSVLKAKSDHLAVVSAANQVWARFGPCSHGACSAGDGAGVC
jgi:hypothetical protein